MSKKRKIDYIIEQSDNKRLIFRFYPKQSSCHSFNDKPPKNWNEVYKVYYSYAVIRQIKWKKEDQWESEVLFYEPCDECSIISDVAERCKLLSEGKTVFKGEYDGEKYSIKLLNNEMHPFGMGTSWTILKCDKIYEFRLFNWNDIGFRFYLEKNELNNFADYLNECCEYMLIHGDPI